MRKILNVVPLARIERAIFFIRGEKVMIDTDLARLYGVETGAFNRAVKRNLSRFPDDFMFQLTAAEAKSLRCQFGTSNAGRGGRRYRAFVFTEQGVAMLSSVLHSDRAVAVNIEIMRAFVRLRRILASNAELARKLEALEKKFDRQFKVVFDAIRQFMSPPETKHREIGFHVRDEGSPKTKARKKQPLGLRADHVRRTSGAWRSWR